MKTIDLRFDKATGEVKVEANGFTGQACKDGTAFLVAALGECTDFQAKAEWYADNLEWNGQVNSNLCG